MVLVNDVFVPLCWTQQQCGGRRYRSRACRQCRRLSFPDMRRWSSRPVELRSGTGQPQLEEEGKNTFLRNNCI